MAKELTLAEVLEGGDRARERIRKWPKWKRELTSKGNCGIKEEMTQRPVSISFIAARAEVFGEVCEAVSRYEGIFATFVPNKYHCEFSDPWLLFEVNGVKFEVGARKRVFSISVNFGKLTNVSSIYNVATKDSTTYEADGRWQADGAAKSICVHAWGAEKLNEYLGILMGLAGWRGLRA